MCSSTPQSSGRPALGSIDSQRTAASSFRELLPSISMRPMAQDLALPSWTEMVYTVSSAIVMNYQPRIWIWAGFIFG